MVKCFLNRKLFVSIVTLLVLCVGLSACDTLRKKFTRQKKEGQESRDFQPVLEPQDYPAPENNSPLVYQQHYALIKAWYRDLWTGVDEKNSDSTVKFSLKQIFEHIDQMKLLLKPEKAAAFDQLANLLKFYQTSLNSSRNVRNYSRIQSDLRAFDRMLRDQLRLDKIKGDLVGR